MMGLPSDIEVLITEAGVFIEIQGFINFLKDDKNVPEEYRAESLHLRKIAEYLEERYQEVLLQNQLINQEYDPSKPN